MADQQNIRAFQKQLGINLNRKNVSRKKGLRMHHSIGLGFKTPKEAITGTYIDKKCPFTGHISIRGRILTGVVRKCIVLLYIRRDYLQFIRKYDTFEKRNRNMRLHLSPCFRDVEAGDIVTLGECRPLSKTVRFNVLKESKMAGSKKKFSKF
nr:ribosomal protein RS11 [Anopheles gambiae]